MHASRAGKTLLAALPKSQRLSLLQKQKLHALYSYFTSGTRREL